VFFHLVVLDVSPSIFASGEFKFRDYSPKISSVASSTLSRAVAFFTSASAFSFPSKPVCPGIHTSCMLLDQADQAIPVSRIYYSHQSAQ
jgi:hypothetical protein